jgi:uncharacterized membrane protein HdeD (DUF308 family)
MTTDLGMFRRRGWVWPVADAVALVAFALVGLLSHHGTVTAGGLARDALPLLGGWFAAALAFRLYRSPSLSRLLATWACGVTVGVAIRALVLGRSFNGHEAAFLGVALAFTLLFLLVLRVAVAVTVARRPGADAIR